MKSLFAAGQHRKLGLLPEGKPANILTLDLPTSGDSDGVAGLIDLEAHCPPVKDQGRVGDCASVAACTWLSEYPARRMGISHTASHTAQYAWVRDSEHIDVKVDSGSTIAAVVTTGQKVGFISDTAYPNDDTKWNVLPPDNIKAAAYHHLLQFAYYCPNVETIDASLQQGFPILFGMELSESFEMIDSSGIYIPAGQDIGGHAMGIIGVNNNMQTGPYKGFYKVRNQWGFGWGDMGNCWIPKGLFMDGTAREMVTGRRSVPV